MIEKCKPAEDGEGVIGPDGCHWDSAADYLFMDVLPSCGCGNPADIGRYVLDCLRRYCSRGDYDESGSYVQTDSQAPAYEDLPAMFFLSWADEQKYIEHGATVRCSWLTPLGKELVKDLEAVLAPTVAP